MAIHYLGNVKNGNVTVMTAAGTPLHKDNTVHSIGQEGDLEFYKTLDGRFLGSEWNQPFGSGMANFPAANKGAQVHFTSRENRQHTIGRLSWSYDTSPTSGVVQIESPSGTVVWQHGVTQAGPGQFDFGEDGLQLPEGNEAIVTLGAGGSTVTGKLSIDTYRLG